jgi:fructose-specific component phosphotransferase system IIB-like protein
MKVRQSAAPRHFRAHSRKQSVSILDTNLAAEISVIIESDTVQDADIPEIWRRDIERVFEKGASFQIKAKRRF